MSQQQRDAVNAIMSSAPVDAGGDAVEQRAAFERMMTARPLLPDVVLTPVALGEVPALGIQIEGTSPDATILWFHGGWYAFGSPRASAGLAADVARRAGARVVSVDYRLAPEHPYPAALEDARAAYRALLESGVDPRSVAVAGESAGGGLAAALLVSLREDGLPQPAGAVLLSPWTDLTLSGASMTAKRGIDPAFVPEQIAVRAAGYAGSSDAADPRVSPVFADLAGVAPLLVQVGSHELLLDDAVRLAARAAADDVAVTLEVTPAVPHVFQSFAAMLDEGGAALDGIGRFLTTRLRSRLVA